MSWSLKLEIFGLDIFGWLLRVLFIADNRDWDSCPERDRMENAYRNELVNRMKSMGLKLTRAVAFATWVYSLLFLMYLLFRLTFNADHVHLDDLFIDYVPFFTFLITAICLLVVNLASLIIYLAIKKKTRRHNGSTNGTGIVRSVIVMIKKVNLTSIIWLFSISIWSFHTYLTLARPSSLPYWPISMMMFVISYICMLYMLATRDSRISHHSV